MAEAIKTLRRALEVRICSFALTRTSFNPQLTFRFDDAHSQDPHLSSPAIHRGSTVGSVGSDKQSTHATKSIHSLPIEENYEELKVHREFIEEEIEALRRSSGDGHDLPPVSFTLTTCVLDVPGLTGIFLFVLIRPPIVDDHALGNR